MLKSVKRIGALAMALVLTFSFAVVSFAQEEESVTEVVTESAAAFTNMVVTIEDVELVLSAGESAVASDIIVPQGEVNALVEWSADSDKYIIIQPNGYIIARSIVYYQIGPFEIGLPNFGGTTTVTAATHDGEQSVSREVVVKFSISTITEFIKSIVFPHEAAESVIE